MLDKFLNLSQNLSSRFKEAIGENITSNSIRKSDYFHYLYHNFIDCFHQQDPVFIDTLQRFVEGFLSFRETGLTPDESHLAAVNLYCRTNGVFQELISETIADLEPFSPFPLASGLLGSFNSVNLQKITHSIREDGYYIFEKKLPEEICDRLLEFSLNTPSHPFDYDGTVSDPILYHRDRLDAVKYHFKEQDLLNCSAIQEILSDFSFLSVAGEYLKTEPILHSVGMWYSTSSADTPSSQAAQLYHFDLDTFKWLKFFIYLTDVTSDTGPHCYIRSSHRCGDKPTELLARGYRRISDEDMSQYYPRDRFVEIAAPRGTVIAGDTRCFHKGKHPKSGHRLLLQPVFCNSLFASYFTSSGDNIPNKKLPHQEPFKSLNQNHPRLYSKYIL